MSDQKFERLLSEIRNERVDDTIVSQAGERVWNAMTAAPVVELSLHTLRNC